jgi:hypothetical protein
VSAKQREEGGGDERPQSGVWAKEQYARRAEHRVSQQRGEFSQGEGPFRGANRSLTGVAPQSVASMSTL